MTLVDGEVVAAYNDDHTRLLTDLVVLRRSHPLGDAIRSRPLLDSFLGGLAIVSAHHTGGGTWKSEIRLHCQP